MAGSQTIGKTKPSPLTRQTWNHSWDQRVEGQRWNGLWKGAARMEWDLRRIFSEWEVDRDWKRRDPEGLAKPCWRRESQPRVEGRHWLSRSRGCKLLQTSPVQFKTFLSAVWRHLKSISTSLAWRGVFSKLLFWGPSFRRGRGISTWDYY